ncbi:MAG TPA: LamG-like jellyroll fold domain-containing protein, partial [Candidatus Nanopelagicales bacterium]|nr:LamG-like jellyroll fold domain-containing protein [Candidatus Nanopelagicales bacterium]
PNVVDPDVFFDRSGKLWMVYGSYSGGIFILELDPATAKPFPGQGYGKHLWGGNHARIEGPAVMFDSGTGYYYLYVTYGGLDASGGYNIRVARSKTPDGPYLDAQGRDMATVKADPDLPLFDDASIAPTGVKLMGSYQFQRVVGDPGTGLGVGAVSPGGSTHWYDPKTKQWYLIFHSRFPGRGEEHEVRVHRLEFTKSGWPVVAPYRYAGERSALVKRSDQVGTYGLIDHGPKTISADIHQARTITLRPDGRITGAVTGRWHGVGKGKDGQSSAVLVVDGVRYEAVFDTGWDPDARRWVTTFSGLSDDGVALWGAQRTLVAPVTAVRRVVADLSLPAETAKDLVLPTEGTQGSTISWASSDPAHLATDGTVTRPGVGEPDAQVRLAATVRNHRARATKELTVRVPAREAGGLVAHYAFDGGLTADGDAGAGRVVGPKIGAAGGQVSYAAGVDGQAVVLDGQSGVQLPDGLVSGATYSVSLWLRPAAYSAYTPAFFAARDSEHWVSLLPQGSTGVGGNSMIWSGTEWYDAGFGQRLPLDEWSHVAFTVDSGRLTAWVDGKQVFSGTGFPDVLTADTGVFSLGVNWWDSPFRGAIDDLRVYDSVLTDAEVAALATR